MSIHKKLLQAKKEMQAITKDSKNPYFKSKYFDINKLLSEVEPILQKHDLLLLQPLGNGSVSTYIHDHESGEQVFSSIDLPNIQDPQKMGSAITYYRRYTLQSLLGLQAEDDDANNASNKNTNNRLPALTDTQFEATKKATKTQILKVLSKFRMSEQQRADLTKLANDGRE